MGNDTPPQPTTTFEWVWETSETTFQKGTDLSAAQQEDLLEAFNEMQRDRCGEITLEDLQNWPSGYGAPDSEFAAQDLTLYTHTNVRTGDMVKIWNYGMGDNDYGTLHFLLADGTQFSFAANHDGDLTFYEVELPESASEDTQKVFEAVEKWYNGIEDERDLAEEAVKALTGLRFKVWGMAPNCDPDTWRELAGD